MIRATRTGSCLLLMFANLALVACELRRPATPPSRVLEPQLLEPQLAEHSETVAKNPDAASIHLLSTESHGNFGRRVLHRQPDGELVEDPVWRWSTSPDRYLDTALRMEVASSPKLRLVDAGDVPTLAADLLTWSLESSGGARLIGAVEFEVTGTDRVVHTQIVRGSESVSEELPGNLAAAAGRLMRHLASEELSFASSERQVLHERSICRSATFCRASTICGVRQRITACPLTCSQETGVQAAFGICPSPFQICSPVTVLL
jgi:hypothetical protein